MLIEKYEQFKQLEEGRFLNFQKQISDKKNKYENEVLNSEDIKEILNEVNK
jgi:hypothetical protein